MKHYLSAIRIFASTALLIASYIGTYAADSEENKIDKINRKSSEKIEKVHKKAKKKINEIHEKANERIAKIMARPWNKSVLSEPIKPIILNPVPVPRPTEPKPLPKPIEREIVVAPITAPVIKPEPEPTPLVQIEEKDSIKEESTIVQPKPTPRSDFNLYGCQYSLSIVEPFYLTDNSPTGIANAWESISNNDNYSTLAYDVIDATRNGNLIGWAALELTDQIAKKYAQDESSIAFLHTWLLVQLGYDSRLANVNGTLYTLFGSKEIPIRNPKRRFSYTIKDGTIYAFYNPISLDSSFYIHDKLDTSLKPISLYITSLPKTDGNKSSCSLTTDKYPEVNINTYAANDGLLDYFSRYPQFSHKNDSPVYQWLNYATTPFENEVISQLEKHLRKLVNGCTELEAVNLILSIVQAIPYEKDDIAWGDDRPYFAQETLNYAKGDCEDHAILFIRLIKDILSLPCALVHYPGHLATAIEFSQPIEGDYIIINNHRMTICDPTYYRPAGYSMPNLQEDKIQAIRF